MKNAFFNRIKFIFLSLMCVFCSIFFFACSNLFSPENSLSDGEKNSEKFYEINGNLFVDGSSPKIFENTNQARSVSAKVPSAIFYAVTAKNAGNSEKLYTAEVSGSTFSIKLAKGTWNITAEGFSDAEKTVSVLKGSVSVSVENENSVKSGISIKMLPQKDGKGNISLSLEAESGSGIKSVSAELAKNDEGSSVYSENLNFSSNAAKIEKNDVPSGVYVLSLKFYSENGGAGELLYTTEEIVNIFNNLTTDTWNGNSVYFNGGKFVVSKSAVENFKMNTFFVQGETNGTYSPAASANDSNAGTYFAPFATVQAAVDKIGKINDGSTKYTVYVDGAVTADTFYGNYSTNNNSFVNISPASMLNLTIKSLSSEKAVVDAGRSTKDADTTGWRVFYIGSKANVIFENITIKGGSLDSAGGGISCDGNLTLKDCLVSENKSNNSGGGICFGGEELALENTEVLCNQSENDGGGISVINIYDSPNVIIHDGKIDNNKSAEKGGGIFSNGTVTISDAKILNNSANDKGGGIYFFGDGEKTISDTEINKNSAKFGGGIYMQDGTLNLESGAVIGEKLAPDNEANDISQVATNSNYGNKATDASYSRAGAGLYIQSGTVNMSEGAYICKNYTSSYGGGVYVSQNGTFNMNGGVIGWNFSRMGGGIIADGADASTSNYSVLNISGTAKICYNKADFTSAEGCTGRGAGIFACGDLNISENVEIFKNQAAKSGAGIHSEKKLVMKGGSIHDNNAETDGAGIFAYKCEAELSGCTISGNEAGGNGGAIYANNESSSKTIVKIGKENSSDDDVLIEKNSANRGGAFYGADNADFVMNAGKVSENYSEGNGGGAMYIWGGNSNYSTFTMNGGKISGNMAKNNGCGGAVHIDHGTGGKAAFIMKGGLLSGNKAADENGNGSKLGGAIYLKAGGKIELSGSAVIDVEKDCNDIYLGISTESVQQKITITGTLAPGNNDAAGNQKYTARITPEEYAVEKEFFQSDSYTITSDDYEKFCVTGNDDSDEWFITDAGKLSKPTAISSLSSAPDLTLYPKLTVSTGDEMNKLSGFVNNGNTMAGTTVTLLNDITLDSDFQKIGNTDKPFSGTFDGNGKKIDSGTASLWAIFYQVTGGTIKNLTSSGKFSMSGIVAYLSNNGLIENCTNTATVTSDTYSPLGGVCAKMEDSVIDGCVNKGSVKLEKSGNSLSLALGGICGSATGVIKNSTNYDSVVYTETISNDSCFVGGILGTTTVSADVDTELYNCINIGDVSGNEESASGIGGILGDAYILNCSVSMKNCVNMGNSSKNAIAGKCVGTSKDKTTIDFTYYLEDSAPSVFAWNHDNAKAYSFKKCADLYMTTDRVTVGTFLSDDLLKLLNAWVDKENLSGATQYLNWDTVDDRPSLVYE